ncbi:hypothetical protein ACTHRZ_12285, partial [Neisseria sp. P0001.S006]|uniref:hypothetical protein n=1 Tax=Neisseria sp. P0001.S006 TaxID=3436650 RepID=UPI003F7DBBAC
MGRQAIVDYRLPNISLSHATFPSGRPVPAHRNTRADSAAGSLSLSEWLCLGGRGAEGACVG